MLNVFCKDDFKNLILLRLIFFLLYIKLVIVNKIVVIIYVGIDKKSIVLMWFKIFILDSEEVRIVLLDRGDSLFLK